MRACSRSGDALWGLPFRTSAPMGEGGTFKSRHSKGGCVNLRKGKNLRSFLMEAPFHRREGQMADYLSVLPVAVFDMSIRIQG